MDILSLRVPLKPLLSRAVLLGTKKEEHNLKASFVAEAAKGGDFDSCDGVRRCGRNWRGWAGNDRPQFCSPGGPVSQLFS